MRISLHLVYYFAFEMMQLYLSRPGPFLRSVINFFSKQETNDAYYIKLHTLVEFFKERSILFQVIIVIHFFAFFSLPLSLQNFFNVFFTYVAFFVIRRERGKVNQTIGYQPYLILRSIKNVLYLVV